MHALKTIGLEDPLALVEAVAAMPATHFVGSPRQARFDPGTLYRASLPNRLGASTYAASKDAIETEREPCLAPAETRRPVVKRFGDGGAIRA